MRRVPLLATLCALIGSLLMPAHAAPGEGILLHGTRTAYVDLYVYVSTTINTTDLRMATTGSYVGFFLSPAPADRDTVGALVMPRVGATGQDAGSTMQLGQSWDVRPGKYRAFLITDGTADVFIPIDGQGYRGWVPRRKAVLSVRNADFDVPAGASEGAHRTPVTLRARSLVIAAGLATSTSLTAIDGIGACVTSRPDRCPALDMKGRLPAAAQWSSSAILEPVGSYSGVLAVQRLAGMDAGSHVAGAIVILTIGLQS
jgi:hypothetical protein